MQESSHLGIKDTEMPLDSEGRTMHLGVNKDEIANRLLSVGDFGRCERLAANLTCVMKTLSKRNFLTYTGLYKDMPMSIVCAGMGIPNTDFLIREAREVIEGPMAMARFGTCGVVKEKITPGDIMLPQSTVLLQQNYDFDPTKDKPESQFYISKPCPIDTQFHEILTKKFEAVVGAGSLHNQGIMATAETFYSGQGRKLKKFKDDTAGLHEMLKKMYPNHESFEMEMYCLYKLAELSVPDYKIYAGGACIGIFNRKTNGIAPKEVVEEREAIGGKCILDTLVEFKFPEGEPENTRRLAELLKNKKPADK